MFKNIRFRIYNILLHWHMNKAEDCLQLAESYTLDGKKHTAKAMRYAVKQRNLIQTMEGS